MQVPRPCGRFAEPASLEPFPGAHTSTRTPWSCLSTCHFRTTALHVCPVQLLDVGDMSVSCEMGIQGGRTEARERKDSKQPHAQERGVEEGGVTAFGIFGLSCLRQQTP